MSAFSQSNNSGANNMSESTTPTSDDQDIPNSPTQKLSFRLQPDGRQVLTRKRARELLAPLATAPYTSISLGGCALGDAAVGIAGPILVTLANKQCVRSVAFADCIASLPQDEALRSLSTLASSIGMWKGLSSVDLSYNALGSRGIAACAALLQGQRRLRELFLVESGLAAESARLLQRYLCPGPTTQLRVLQVHANRLDSLGVGYLATVVERSPHLERLRMSSLGASSAALSNLANALRGKDEMHDLDLSDNFLDSSAAADLAAVLVTLPKLERLLVRDLAMGDEAAEMLLRPLATADHLMPLAELAVAGNELTAVSVEHIGEVLVTFKNTLQVLDLSRNELGGKGADWLSESLARAKDATTSPALTNLLLAKNDIPSLPIVRVCLQLIAFPELQCLDFCGNQVSEQIADSIGTALGSSVVLYDSEGAEYEGVDESPGSPTTENGDQVALQIALQELANAPSVVKRTDSQLSSKGEVLSRSSSQSMSAVSRLRSMFSRGSEDGTRSDGDIPRPANNVEVATEAAPIGEHRPSFEEDSGVIGEDGRPQTPDAAARVRTGDAVTGTSSSTTDSRDVPESTPYTPMSRESSSPNAEVIQSAKKLKESLSTLDKELSDVTGELQIPVVSPSIPRNTAAVGQTTDGEGEVDRNVNEYLLIGDVVQMQYRAKQSVSSLIVDVLGGLLVAVFVVVLVLAIAQSQEESTFAYRLV